MPTNILKALLSLVKYKNNDLKDVYRSSIRINQAGDALEYYVKDIFCDSLNVDAIDKKEKIYSKYFSWGGNSKNPPDAIIKNGDAIEIKKIEAVKGQIPLNSSYPKAKLHSDSPLITNACRSCEENWACKDIIYSIGILNKLNLKLLWFVYGDCYAADKEVYERIKDNMTNGITKITDVDFSDTNEIARINKVDPLGITYLRIRGMWGIENPLKVFDYIVDWKDDGKFNAFALMKQTKYLSFSKEDRALIDKNKNIEKIDVEIKNPNNTAQFIKAILLKASF